MHTAQHVLPRPSVMLASPAGQWDTIFMSTVAWTRWRIICRARDPSGTVFRTAAKSCHGDCPTAWMQTFASRLKSAILFVLMMRISSTLSCLSVCEPVRLLSHRRFHKFPKTKLCHQSRLLKERTEYLHCRKVCVLSAATEWLCLVERL